MTTSDPAAAQRAETFIDNLVAAISPDELVHVDPTVREAVVNNFKAEIRQGEGLAESALNFYANLDKVIKPAGRIYMNETAMSKLSILAAAEVKTTADLLGQPEAVGEFAKGLSEKAEAIGFKEGTFPGFVEQMVKSDLPKVAHDTFPAIENFMGEMNHAVIHTAPAEMQEMLKGGFKSLAIKAAEATLAKEGIDLHKLVTEGTDEVLAKFESGLSETGLTLDDLRTHYAAAAQKPISSTTQTVLLKAGGKRAGTHKAGGAETTLHKAGNASSKAKAEFDAVAAFDQKVEQVRTTIGRKIGMLEDPVRQEAAMRAAHQTETYKETLKALLPLEELNKLPLSADEKRKLFKAMTDDLLKSEKPILGVLAAYKRFEEKGGKIGPTRLKQLNLAVTYEVADAMEKHEASLTRAGGHVVFAGAEKEAFIAEAVKPYQNLLGHHWKDLEEFRISTALKQGAEALESDLRSNFPELAEVHATAKLQREAHAFRTSLSETYLPFKTLFDEKLISKEQRDLLLETYGRQMHQHPVKALITLYGDLDKMLPAEAKILDTTMKQDLGLLAAAELKISADHVGHPGHLSLGVRGLTPALENAGIDPKAIHAQALAESAAELATKIETAYPALKGFLANSQKFEKLMVPPEAIRIMEHMVPAKLFQPGYEHLLEKFLNTFDKLQSEMPAERAGVTKEMISLYGEIQKIAGPFPPKQLQAIKTTMAVLAQSEVSDTRTIDTVLADVKGELAALGEIKVEEFEALVKDNKALEEALGNLMKPETALTSEELVAHFSETFDHAIAQRAEHLSGPGSEHLAATVLERDKALKAHIPFAEISNLPISQVEKEQILDRFLKELETHSPALREAKILGPSVALTHLYAAIKTHGGEVGRETVGKLETYIAHDLNLSAPKSAPNIRTGTINKGLAENYATESLTALEVDADRIKKLAKDDALIQGTFATEYKELASFAAQVAKAKTADAKILQDAGALAAEAEKALLIETPPPPPPPPPPEYRPSGTTTATEIVEDLAPKGTREWYQILTHDVHGKPSAENMITTALVAAAGIGTAAAIRKLNRTPKDRMRADEELPTKQESWQQTEAERKTIAVAEDQGLAK